MNIQKFVAIFFVVAGALGLAYGGFTYTSDRHTAEVGSVSLTVAEQEDFNIPIWAGLALVFVGGALLVVRKTA
ncbi:hypothetical protein [Reinekea sp. G2M2-21]|uniref:hypothetical protein n=1 Tax=Reinekea sp. G2M2-21 TaxID=2788942 RepID=UPI0018AA7A68|nr:hypothetical protein [Reinekea sp. G2M2-21]